jgi:hypothetical protein
MLEQHQTRHPFHYDLLDATDTTLTPEVARIIYEKIKNCIKIIEVTPEDSSSDHKRTTPVTDLQLLKFSVRNTRELNDGIVETVNDNNIAKTAIRELIGSYRNTTFTFGS